LPPLINTLSDHILSDEGLLTKGESVVYGLLLEQRGRENFDG